MSDKSFLEWVGELTAAGYDIVGSSGHTLRNDPDDHWNGNYPMPSLVVHFNNGKTDIVIKAYATHSRHWTIYGNMFSGNAPNRYFGFDVRGKKETEIDSFEKLQSLVSETVS